LDHARLEAELLGAMAAWERASEALLESEAAS
jgi:hypothetical protein